MGEVGGVELMMMVVVVGEREERGWDAVQNKSNNNNNSLLISKMMPRRRQKLRIPHPWKKITKIQNLLPFDLVLSPHQELYPNPIYSKT